MLTIIAATRNPAKVEQLSHLLSGVAQVEAASHDISPEPDAERLAEAAGDFNNIARAKAVAWSHAVIDDRCVIATDGGLLIPGLGSNWDPVRTRRFAGDGASDLDRARALLALTAHLEGAGRQISWCESVAIAKGGAVLESWTAVSDPGLLATDVNARLIASGKGFWIPAVWRCPEFDGQLLAELSESERAQRIDHWARLQLMIRAWMLGAIT